MVKIAIKGEFIKLDQFLKFSGAASSGGISKVFIANCDITVNGIVVKERGKKLYKNDIIVVKGIGEYEVC